MEEIALNLSRDITVYLIPKECFDLINIGVRALSGIGRVKYP